MDNDELKKLISEEIKRNVEFVIGEGPEDTQWGRKPEEDPRKMDPSKIALDPTVHKKMDLGPEEPPPQDAKMISYNDFLTKFKETQGEAALKKTIAKGVLKYFNEKRAELGKEDAGEIEELYTSFKNSEFAIEHLQHLVEEEKEKDE